MPYPGYTGEYPFHGPAVADTENFDCAPGTEAVRDRIDAAQVKRESIQTKPLFSPDGSSVLASQVAGVHYKQLKIQPVEYINANDLDFLQGNVVKYITRHKNKGRAEDVRKALHFCQLILELQYGEEDGK